MVSYYSINHYSTQHNRTTLHLIQPFHHEPVHNKHNQEEDVADHHHLFHKKAGCLSAIPIGLMETVIWPLVLYGHLISKHPWLQVSTFLQSTLPSEEDPMKPLSGMRCKPLASTFISSPHHCIFSLYPIMSFTSHHESVVCQYFSISPNLELVSLLFRIACHMHCQISLK